MFGHGGFSISMAQSKAHRPCKVDTILIVLFMGTWDVQCSLNQQRSGLAVPFENSNYWIVNAAHEIWSIWKPIRLLILESEDPGGPMFFIFRAATRAKMPIRFKPCCEWPSLVDGLTATGAYLTQEGRSGTLKVPLGFLLASLGRIPSLLSCAEEEDKRKGAQDLTGHGWFAKLIVDLQHSSAFWIILLYLSWGELKLGWTGRCCGIRKWPSRLWH